MLCWFCRSSPSFEVLLGSDVSVMLLVNKTFSTYVCAGTRQNVEWGGSPLVSFDHVIDPHFVTFSSSLYTTTSNPNANPNSNPNHNPYPNRNHTVITDPHINPIDPQIITGQIRPTLHFVVCHLCLVYLNR